MFGKDRNGVARRDGIGLVGSRLEGIGSDRYGTAGMEWRESDRKGLEWIGAAGSARIGKE